MSEDKISRRRVLTRIGGGAAIAWSTPILTSIRTPAFAQSGFGCDPGQTCKGCPDQSCQGNPDCVCWLLSPDQGNACWCGAGIKIVCGEEPPCATQADCDNRCPGCGFRCVQACDGQQCCRSPCVS